MHNLSNLIVSTLNGLHTDSIFTIDKMIIDFFNSMFDGNGIGNLLLIILSYLVCIILIGIVGYQREAQGHNAGFRTHLLVGIGSCTIMIVSMYSIGYSADKYETMRLAASVPTGIGFLGAGVIIKNKTSIKGLTTASTLWVSMAIGLACGSGNFVIAIIGSCAVYLTLFVFYRFEIHAGKKASKLIVYLDRDSQITYKQIIDVIDVFQYTVKETYMRHQKINNQDVLAVYIEFNNCYLDILQLMKRDIELTFHPIRVDIEIYAKDRVKKLPD